MKGEGPRSAACPSGVGAIDRYSRIPGIVPSRHMTLRSGCSFDASPAPARRCSVWHQPRTSTSIRTPPDLDALPPWPHPVGLGSGCNGGACRHRLPRMARRATPTDAPEDGLSFPDASELAALRATVEGLDSRVAVERYAPHLLGDGKSARAVISRTRRLLQRTARLVGRDDLAELLDSARTRPGTRGAARISSAIEELRSASPKRPMIGDPVEDWFPPRRRPRCTRLTSRRWPRSRCACRAGAGGGFRCRVWGQRAPSGSRRSSLRIPI